MDILTSNIINTALRIRHHRHRYGRGYNFKTTTGLLMFAVGIAIMFIGSIFSAKAEDKEKAEKIKDIFCIVGFAVVIFSYIADITNS